jgi:GNAT superfamily N-acetyltransferase
MAIEYCADDRQVTPAEFIALFSARAARPVLDEALLTDALASTINVTARDRESLVGCVRLLSDGYLFTAVAELMLHPDYTGQGIEQRLLELAEDISPAGLWFGVHKLDDVFMRILGWHRGSTTYYKRKPLRTVTSKTEGT